jgi:dTDP-4-dehydrorhamnose reductase
MTSKTVIILGSTGQLGSELFTLLSKDANLKVHGLPHGEIDVTDAALMESVFSSHNPQLLINCTAYNFVEQASTDPGPAFDVNAGAVGHMARLCAAQRCYFVHFSTDYVFDGKSGRPYREDDPTAPLNIYGLSKTSGEQAIGILNDRACIIRTCGVYGFRKTARPGHNFIEKILQQVPKGETIKVRNDLVCTPTSAFELARATVELIQIEPSGIFHITAAGECSWYEFARAILDEAGVGSHPITATQGHPQGSTTPRPAYTVLSNEKLHRSGVRPLLPWREALHEYFQRRDRELIRS